MNDEFVELYNSSASPVDISGWRVRASNAAGTTARRATIAAGTILPPRAHYLVVNHLTTGGPYSGAVPGDQTYDLDASGINDEGGVAITLPDGLTVIDQVGLSAGSAYKEGTPLTNPAPSSTNLDGEYSFVRKLTSGVPQDTDDNAADFIFISVNGATYGGRPSRLGAPGPENRSSPVQRNDLITVSLIDPAVPYSDPPNSVRRQCSPMDPLVEECDPNRSARGTFSIRRRWTNNTGADVTQLRFRIVDVTTGPTPPAGTADLRAISSGQVTETVTGGSTVTIEGTTLENSAAQPLGGGYNSTLAAGTITMAAPLPNGASVNLQFLLGVQQPGAYRFFVNVEALP